MRETAMVMLPAGINHIREILKCTASIQIGRKLMLTFSIMCQNPGDSVEGEITSVETPL